MEDIQGEISNLINRLQLREEKDRLSLIETLGQFGCRASAAIPYLQKLLTDDDRHIRLATARSIALIAPLEQEAALLVVAKCLQEQDAAFREQCMYVLGSFGRSGLSLLVGALNDPNDGVILEAINSLREIGSHALPALPSLVPLFTHPNREIRGSAIAAVHEMGPGAALAIPDLISVLAMDPDAHIRADAAFALAGVGRAASDSAPALAACLIDHDEVLRFRAAHALSRLGEGAKAVIGQLRSGLSDSHPGVVTYLLEALGNCGREAKVAIDDIDPLTSHPNASVRQTALEAIAKLLRTK